MKITKIYTYPIKGLRAYEPESAILTKNGFPHDRRFILLQVQEDGSHKNMAVAHFPELTQYFTSINVPEDGDVLKGTITVTHRPSEGEEKSLEIPLRPRVDGLEEVEVTMHKSPVKAYKLGSEYDSWFKDRLGFEVNLVYMGENLRKVLMTTSGNRQTQPASNGWLSSWTSKATEMVVGAAGTKPDEITFADCAPYLIVSDKSMEDVNHRLPNGEQMDISKFRPNIIVSGANEVWDEDFWAEITIGGDTKIVCEHNCGRCKSINIDYATGKPGTGPSGTMLKELSRDRRVDPGCKWSPVFGRYSFLHPSSEGHEIQVGDEVVVSKRSTERTAFDWEGLTTLK